MSEEIVNVYRIETRMTRNKKKIAIFHTDHADEWTHPYGTFDQMTSKLLDETMPNSLSKKDITYKVFDIYNGDIPTREELNRDEYMGIFITGSRYDSFSEDTDWIVRLRKLLVELLLNDERDDKSKDLSINTPPIVGICFGHQVVAHALGGRVDRNPLGYEGGVVPIDLNETGIKLFGQDKINLSMVHNDAVLELPKHDPSIVNWGSTKRCSIQGFYKPGCLLTFQGHPEFVSEVAKRGWEKSLSNPNSKFSEGQVEEMERLTSSLENHGYTVAADAIWKLFINEI